MFSFIRKISQKLREHENMKLGDEYNVNKMKCKIYQL